MFEGVVSIVVGVILILFLAGFIAAANTENLSDVDTMILGFLPTLILISLVYGAVKLITGKTGRGL